MGKCTPRAREFAGEGLRRKYCLLKISASVLLFSALIGGCQKPEEKLAELDSERMVSCLHAQRVASEVSEAYRLLPTLDGKGNPVATRSEQFKSAGLDTLTNQMQIAKAQCELATRNYEKFGR